MVGRSHNVAAQVTTLGKRFASCAEELLFAHTALKELIARLPLRGIKGPIGTSQDAVDAMGKDFANLEKSIAEEFGFELHILFNNNNVYCVATFTAGVAVIQVVSCINYRTSSTVIV